MSRLMESVEDALRSYKNNDIDLESARDIIMSEVSDIIKYNKARQSETEESETMQQVREVRKELWDECLKESKGDKKKAYKIYKDKCRFELQNETGGKNEN